MMERVHRKILRTIQGLPSCCPSSSLNALLGSNDALLGSNDIESRIAQRKLNFINSCSCLDDTSLLKRLLLARVADPSVKGLVPKLEELLDQYNLPGISSLLRQSHIKPESWKRSIKKQIHIKSYLRFLSDCMGYHIGECDIKLGRPLQHLSITLGKTSLTQANNFRTRLLVGCDGLEKDAVRFRYRNNTNTPSDPSYKLCSAPCEDVYHFISFCPSLNDERQRLIANAPPSVYPHLPDPSTRPEDFADVILESDWIDNRDVQAFCINFLQQLKNFHSDKIVTGLLN